MFQFFNDMSYNPFLLTGLLAGFLASVACGTIGPYVIARRMVFLAGAIAHVAVGGLGAAIFLAASWPASFGWLSPMYGALLAALLAAVLIGWVQQKATERLDTLIGAMWAVGMALGVLLIKFTPGYHTELMSYLFGNIAYVPWQNVYLMLGLDVLIVALVLLLHKRLLALCLDEEHAGLQGVSVLGTNILLLCLVALTVICLIEIVGLILIMALLTLPAATASHRATRMGSVIGTSLVLCILLTTIPRIVVYGSRISPEAAIVLASAGLYLGSLGIKALRTRWMASRAMVGVGQSDCD